MSASWLGHPSKYKTSTTAAASHDLPTGGRVLGVVVEHVVGEPDNVRHSLVGDPIVDSAVLSACRNEAAPAKTGQVV